MYLYPWYNFRFPNSHQLYLRLSTLIVKSLLSYMSLVSPNRFLTIASNIAMALLAFDTASLNSFCFSTGGGISGLLKQAGFGYFMVQFSLCLSTFSPRNCIVFESSVYGSWLRLLQYMMCTSCWKLVNQYSQKSSQPCTCVSHTSHSTNSDVITK